MYRIIYVTVLALLSCIALAAAEKTKTEQCRPQGLYATPNLAVPYCSVYDHQGREKLGPDHQRRIIGYFTSWRHGKNGQPSYLVKDIPWQKLTHINYAFAHIDNNYRLSVGNVANPENPAAGMTWPGVAGAEMDPTPGVEESLEYPAKQFDPSFSVIGNDKVTVKGFNVLDIRVVLHSG